MCLISHKIFYKSKTGYKRTMDAEQDGTGI